MLNIVGGVYFGASVVFNISTSNFTNCTATNNVGDGAGGAIFSSSSSSGLRYLSGLIFGNNVAGRYFTRMNIG
jgi:hypothetical protein